ncbi:hypothetical protein LCGC14_0415700 [marine sediment metagenome]|uniref:AP2/ERF domain-containing protein n=1 Tax=marine sediment metagenome TaxID=412755 RepID=A0A0F9SYD9_9ZZZZ
MLVQQIELSNGMFTTVDAGDFKWLNQWKWSFNKGYVIGGHRPEGKNSSPVLMHRVIMDPPNDKFVDHTNHDTLDNRRCNLRVCTKGQNQFNKLPQGGTSRFKGVSWNEQTSKYKVQIQFQDKKYYPGYFINEIEAAITYDLWAIKLFGEFAHLNFLNKGR